MSHPRSIHVDKASVTIESPNIGYSSRLLLPCALVLIALAVLPAVSSAAQRRVAWSLHSVAQPTSFSTSDTEPQVVKVSVAATGGTFTLAVEGATTGPIAFDAPTSEVKAALDALPSIGGVGGNVLVTGGPGNAVGSEPYVITVGGTLTGKTVKDIVSDSTSLTGEIGEAFVFSQPGRFLDLYTLILTNVGGRASEGPITLTDTLPAGVTTSSRPTQTEEEGWQCPTEAGESVVTCTYFASVPPATPANTAIFIRVRVSSGVVGPLINQVSVSGGVSECGEPGNPPCPTAIAENQTPLDEPPTVVSPLDFGTSYLDPSGVPETRAASHPAAITSFFDFPSAATQDEQLQVLPLQDVKQVAIDLPVGIVGSAQAAPKCLLIDLVNNGGCARSTRVGTLSLIEPPPPGILPGAETNLIIYNVVPEHGYPAEFGVFDPTLQRSALMFASVVGAGSSLHLRTITQNLPQALAINGIAATFFGNPALANQSGNSPVAFFTNPSDCTASFFSTAIHVDSWQHPGAANPDGTPDFSDPDWKSASSVSPPVTGCESLQFKPNASFKPEGSSSDSPTGLAVNIHIPQNEDPNGLATPPLRDATVTLPKGLAVNPSSADGLAGCSSAQIAVATNDPGTCPQASQIGEIEISTPLLDHSLPGKVYLGTPNCSPCSNADAAAGKLIKLYIEVNDPPTGVIVKLPGSGSVDPVSGQITATFEENPQLPFEDLDLTFKGGPRATLTTPPNCGHYTTTTDFKPWSAPQSGPDATPQSGFDLTGGPNGSACASGEAALPNAPSFEAGTTAPIAGAYSPFVFKLSRENGSQRISAIDTTLPEGLLGKLAGIPYCPGAAIDAAESRSGNAEKASPSCPLASEVGVVNVGAGSGTPFYAQGRAYLAGPYKDAPLSLAIITPAVAGPFDLGTVVVRTALYVNESTTQIHAVSDPIPAILAGIPLDVRSIALNMNRPNFTLNPTSCNTMQVLGAATSTLGNVALLQNRFQVGACSALGFKPNLSLSLTGGTRRANHPALKSVVNYPRGSYANIARAVVTLPETEGIDNAHINNPCTRIQFHENACPSKSVLGTARAFSPLLDKPLEGSVYFRANGGEHLLPDIVADLRGQIHVVLVGNVDALVKKGSGSSRIRTTFAQVPDAPVSKFVLSLFGGKRGLLVNSTNLCKAPNRAVVKLTAHNGKTYDTNPRVTNSCEARGRKRSRHS